MDIKNSSRLREILLPNPQFPVAKTTMETPKYGMVCPQKSESQYLSYTLFVSSFQERRQISMSDVCVLSFIDSSNDTTYQSDFLTSSLKISFRAIPRFTIYFSLFCSNRIFCLIWLPGNIDWKRLTFLQELLLSPLQTYFNAKIISAFWTKESWKHALMEAFDEEAIEVTLD